MKKSIFYWSPCLDLIGTVKSTINSAVAINKYSKGKFDVHLINACGEWNNYRDFCLSNNIKLISLGNNFYKFLPKRGFFASRLSYILIILFSFIPIIKMLNARKPDYIVLHLLTSMPLILLNLLPFKTKFILRISGHPKLTFLRKFLWRLSSKKLFIITTPTRQLMEYLKESNIFSKKKIFFLPDAIINLSYYKKKITEAKFFIPKAKLPNKFFLSIGRLTKQKNFNYLINEFYKFSLINKDLNLVIIGEGEQKKLLLNLIRVKRLEDRVSIINNTDNVYYFMKKAEAFILSSLWEEVGFVIVESALSNLYIISSDCPNGPEEFLLNGKAGSVYKSNITNELFYKMKIFYEENKNSLLLKRKLAKKQTRLYTIFNHYTVLSKILNKDENYL